VIVDALGNLIRFVLLPGQRHDITSFDALMAGIYCLALIGDKGFDAGWLRERLRANDMEAVIPLREGTPRFNYAAASNDPATGQHAGDGFLMRQGYTLLWNGWMNGLPATNNTLRIELPVATNPSGPIVETVWDELLFNETEAKQARLTYKATSTDQALAKLLVREHNSDEPTVIPADNWEFVDAQTVRLLPAGTPFKIGAIYQFIYKAANPPVTGIGFAATRDIVSFARYATADERRNAQPADRGRPAGAHPHALARQLAERALPARFPLQRLQRG
jgi:hypothetical protein